MTAQLRFLVLEHLSVWHCGFAPLTAKNVSPAVAKSLNRASLASALGCAYNPSDRPRSWPPSTLHPLVYQRIPAFLHAATGEPPEVMGASLFVANQEEGCKSGVTATYFPVSSRVGSSSLHYNPSLGANGKLTDGPSPGDETMWRAPAAILIGASPRALISVIAVLCRVDAQLPECGTTSLIIAPRHAYPQVRAHLGGCLPPGGFADAPTLRAMKDLFTGGFIPSVLLISLELVLCHDPVGDRLWDRCFIMGWPKSSDALTRANVVPKSNFTVALSLLNEDDSGRSYFRTEEADIRFSRVSRLMRIPQTAISDPETLYRLVSNRLHRMPTSNAQRGPTVIRYTVTEGPAPSETELRKTAGVGEISRARSIILGGVAIKGPFPWVTSSSQVAKHFSEHSAKSQTSEFSTRSHAGEREDACPICFDSGPDTVTLCGHWFCAHCLLPALINVPACPLCKGPTDRFRDVVTVGKPVACAEQIAFIRFVASELSSHGKTVLVCSFGELHEKFASALRKLGRAMTTWCGNARQIQLNYDRFMADDSAVLLVDPVALPLRWVSFPSGLVKRIVVLAPLCTRRSEVGCQLREVLDACGRDTPMTVVTRGASDTGMPETCPCATRECVTLVRAT